MTTEMETLLTKIDSMKQELDYIKQHMVERDEIMTLTEFEAYKKSFNKNSLVSLDDAKKQLGF